MLMIRLTVLTIISTLLICHVTQGEDSQPSPAQDKEQAQTSVAEENWVVLSDALSYLITHPGTEEQTAKQDDFVVISYSVKAKDAQQNFAWSAPGKGYTFQIGHANILPGLQKGVVGMKVGEHRKLRIGATLGFGNLTNKHVPPGTDLEAEVSMLSIRSPVTWEVLEPGQGERKAKPGDVIAINYLGTLTDGTEFDRNESSTLPMKFGVNTRTVITGLSMGVMDMSLGEKRRIVIPPHFAYGDKGRPQIPAKSTLIFEVACLGVEDGYFMRTIKPSKGEQIKPGQKGEFAMRIEDLMGKVLYDTQFSSPVKLTISERMDPAGLYYVTKDMRVGEVRQAGLKPQLGFMPGKPNSRTALNVTLDLIRIVTDTPDEAKEAE